MLHAVFKFQSSDIGNFECLRNMACNAIVICMYDAAVREKNNKIC